MAAAVEQSSRRENRRPSCRRPNRELAPFILPPSGLDVDDHHVRGFPAGGFLSRNSGGRVASGCNGRPQLASPR